MAGNSSDGISLTVSPLNGTNWVEWYGVAGNAWASLVERSRECLGTVDFLWIIQDAAAFYFLFVTGDPGTGQISGWLAKSSPINLYLRLDTSYLLMASDEDPAFRRAIEKTYSLFVTNPKGFNLDVDFPLFRRNREDRSAEKLVIHYGQAGPYITQIPFDFYSAFGFGSFGGYRLFEYIGSERDFLTAERAWTDLLEKGGNAYLFIQHAYIIVNIYPDFGLEGLELTLVEDALTVLKDIRCSISGIQTAKGNITLRFSVNPGKEELLRELMDPKTWFVFADFHTVDGCWVLPIDTPGFYEELLRGDLSHILLMRVFHCHSLVGSPNRANIVRQLLVKRVGRVEGSLFKQHIRAYLEYLLMLFSKTSLNVFFHSDNPLKTRIADVLDRLRQQQKNI
jgi:hypothetical protein